MRKASAYIERMAGTLLTADELLRMNIPNRRSELVRGQLRVREPAGFRHGVIAGRICALLDAFVRARSLGVVVAAETGFVLARDPDTVRAPDAGFVSTERLPARLPSGYAEFTPDLAVEVLSPGDRPGELLEKVADWLKSDARLVWIIDPERRVARVYRADGSESIVQDGGKLVGEEVVPGFECELAEVLGSTTT